MPKSKPAAARASDKEHLLPNKSNDESKVDVNNKTAANIPPKASQSVTNASIRSKTNRPPPSGTATVRPSTIMSLEDRDIVVIDNVDYKESTSSEGTIIVVEKPIPYHIQQQQSQQQLIKTHEVDLTELLGATNWPPAAGDIAAALSNPPATSEHSNLPSFSSTSTSSNSSNNYQPSYTVERNRSKNPLSHLGQPKIRRSLTATTSSSAMPKSVNLINLDSDGSSSSNENHYATDGFYSNYQTPMSSVPVSKPVQAAARVPAPSSVAPTSEHLERLNLDIGSMVEVSREGCDNVYGVIRWIGFLPSTKILSVGVELEDEQGNQTNDDGAINGARLFTCPPGRALFVQPEQCSVDQRFQDVKLTHGKSDSERKAAASFGNIECPVVEGSVAPLKLVKLLDLENKVCGKFKGIQGHYNSCYLDATLFAMFTFTYVFDTLLFRPPTNEDIANYHEVQKVLREEIVNPLRKNLFVRADRVMKLRELLEKLSSVTGLTCEEKDPEEFLNSLLAQIMRAEPFLKLNSGQDAFYYQLFVEKDERLSFPTVQQLFEQSFLASDIKLKEVPSCLIIQMPRFGKNFKMYPRILPSQVLDVTDVIDGSPRQCCVCGKLAELECKECFGSLQFGAGLESTSFCKLCLEKVHSHDKRLNHSPRELEVPHDFLMMAEHITVPRIFMELFAVVCIETSHYVAFVKCGSGLDAPWCFFDSMADRKGEKDGYNIPEVVAVPNLPLWLSEEGAKDLNERYLSEKQLPEHAKRLMCDAYMCMYQTDVMMYR